MLFLTTEPAAAAIDFTGVTLPFTVNDLLTSGMGLLQILGPFVILGLAILLVPRLISVIKSAAPKGGNK